jgi:outer membrane protein assembly factor BamB
MMKTTLPFSLLMLIGGMVHAATNGISWNQFRGPNGSGVADAFQPPVELGARSLIWKKPVPPGLSSPALSRDRIFLTAAEGERLVTLALDAASGKMAWTQPAPVVPAEKVHEVNSPATPTPHVDDGRVHVYFGAYGLLCYDLDGRELWRKPIPTPKSLYGSATSPIGHGDHLILVVDNEANLPDSKLSQSRMLALKKATGELVWETARPLQRSGWSTPTIWSHADGEDLVVLGSGRLCGYDPRTGAEKWFTTGFSRETIAQPISGRGQLYASAAMLGGVPDEQPDPEPFWKAMLRFDTNGDGKVARGEMTKHFTYPLRPDLPVEHPGFGIPLPTDEARRKQRQNETFGSMDKDKDGFLTREELIANLSFRRGKPMLIAVRPGGRGEVTDTHVAWQLNRSIPEIPSPLFHQDRIYMVRNGGLLTCVNAVTGKIVYDQRLEGAGQYSASPVIAAGHLYLVSNRGLVSVVKAGDAFELVHQHDLGEPAFVTPAFDPTTIYIRTQTNLCAFRSGG